MIRPQLHVDGRYALYAGLAALIVGAVLILVAVLVAARVETVEPTPTSFIVGPDGDDVEVHP